MKELRTLKMDSDMMDFMEVYNYNKSIIGNIAIRQDVHIDYIKMLTIFPLKGKKLSYFLKLDQKAKAGYMSSYIMKIAKRMNIPNPIIKSFQEMKEKVRVYQDNDSSAEEIGRLLSTNIQDGLLRYKYKIKCDIYEVELSKMTEMLCNSIFEMYDKAKQNMFREQKLERITKEKEQ